MTEKILIVDDDAGQRMLAADALAGAGFRVVTASRAEQALAEAREQRPDLVLCDVVLPDLDGVSVCRALKADRRTAAIPVVLMSGLRRADTEQAHGLELGADDYVLKPVPPRLLAARLRAVMRRRPSTEEGPLRSGALKLDLAGRIAAAGGRPLPLTRKEFDLLALLLEKHGRVLGPAFLLETVWGCDNALDKDPHTIEVHVSSLRRKLGPRLARRVVTVPGLGYRFDKERA